MIGFWLGIQEQSLIRVKGPEARDQEHTKEVQNGYKTNSEGKNQANEDD